MALIVDPDSLTQGVEVTFNTGAKTIALNIAGNLSTDGVTLKALYSFCKEEWKNDTALIRYPFPFTPITDEQFELKDGWNFANDATRYLIRTGGWAVVDTQGVVQEMWAGVITLGSLVAGTQVYYQQSGASAPDFQLQGPVNQAIKIYTNGGTDDRGTLTLFARKQGSTFAIAGLSSIGVTGTMTYQVYRFPLATSTDLKISLGDNVVSAAPYSGITITYYGANIQRVIGGVTYDFNVEIDGAGQSIQGIYETLQYRLRQDSNINSGVGTVTGKTANELAFFLGDILKLRSGVYLTNFAEADTNNILHDPIGAAADIAFPFTATLQLVFGANLVNDTDAIYRVFFTNDDAGDNTGRDFGTATAITVQDSDDVNMSGLINGQSTITLSYDYDGNVQRGAASAGTPAPITVVAIGLTTGQYVLATGTIARSTANSVSLVAALERNYANPV